MNVTVVTSATSTDGLYGTLANFRLVLGTTSTEGQHYDLDQYQLRLLGVASRWVDRYLGYPVGFQRYREVVAGYGTPNLMVSRTPIRALEAVYNATSTASGSASTDIVIEDAESGILRRTSAFVTTERVHFDMSRTILPGSPDQPWLICYSAGYTLAGTSSTVDGATSTGRTLPYEIEQATYLKAVKLLERTEDIESQRIGDLEITYRSDVARGAIAPRRSEEEQLLIAFRRGF